MCRSVSVARSVTLGTVQVLRPGPQGEAASHAALPRMVSQGQLRMYCTSAMHTVCVFQKAPVSSSFLSRVKGRGGGASSPQEAFNSRSG